VVQFYTYLTYNVIVGVSITEERQRIIRHDETKSSSIDGLKTRLANELQIISLMDYNIRFQIVRLLHNQMVINGHRDTSIYLHVYLE